MTDYSQETPIQGMFRLRKTQGEDLPSTAANGVGTDAGSHTSKCCLALSQLTLGNQVWLENPGSKPRRSWGKYL